MADDLTIKIEDRALLRALENLRNVLGGSISVEVGTNVVYAAIQQFGGLAGRGHSRSARSGAESGGAYIPAHPYLGVSREDRTELLAIFGDHARRAWKGERLTGADAARAIGRYLKSSTQLRFRAQKTPDGQAWPPSQRVLARGGQTLRLTSRLRNSITYRSLF